MKSWILLLCLLGAFSVSSGNECSKRIGDVVFILQGSNQFWYVKTFVRKLIEGVPIGLDKFRVGVVTFSTEAHIEISLTSYTTKQHLINRVNLLTARPGPAYIEKALKKVNSEMFTIANGDRPWANNTVILITDGKTPNTIALNKEVEAMRQRDITIIAIGGGGSADKTQLDQIASDPDSRYSKLLTGFQELETFRTFFFYRMCKSSTLIDCGIKTADIIFSIDTGLYYPSDIQNVTALVKKLVESYDIASNRTRIGLLTFDKDSRKTLFNLNKYSTKEAIVKAVDDVKYTSCCRSDIGEALKYAYTNMFTQNNGDRPEAPNIEIVITNAFMKIGTSQNVYDQAQKTRNHRITVFSVDSGRTPELSKNTLEQIAALPPSEHVTTVGNFDKEEQIKSKFAPAACPDEWECPLDPCPPGACKYIPCQNGGSCTAGTGNTYTCKCKYGFTGVNCETNIDECVSNTCLNGATCIDEIGYYSCQCPPDYLGSICHYKINDCDPNMCYNGAECVDGINSFTCICVPGYGGFRCRDNINECAGDPCKNGGTCIDGVNKYTCNCLAGYTGTDCNTDIDYCASAPCKNGGTCVDGVTSYTCICGGAFSGINCETQIHMLPPCKDGYYETRSGYCLVEEF